MNSPILNFIAGKETAAASGALFDKLSPHSGAKIFDVTRSQAADIESAVAAAKAAYPAWSARPAVQRGDILHRICDLLRDRRAEMAELVSLETGKSVKHALGETDAAIACGMFFAGEGQRLYARTTTSGTPHKSAMTIRCPLGVAGLIIAANTPIANVAWKVFPALICGNTAVLKAAEDTPATAALFGRIAREAGLPDGVLNIVQGLGREAGPALISHPDVAVVSFTGSTAVGRTIAADCGRLMKRMSLELGGKNPLIVCEDADLEAATQWIIQSAFSNAGQRCAAGSRIIIVESVYEALKERLIAAAGQLKLGPGDSDDLGPVINLRQLESMLGAVQKCGGTILCGGQRLDDEAHRGGYYVAPTFVEGVDPRAEISQCELFGPIACLYKVTDYAAALAMANDSPYGLTACIHTKNVHRAMHFIREVEAGVAVVNAGTFGSEPHMPFGGLKQSGNGSREPGTEAIDVYSNLKDVYITFDPVSL